MRSLIIDLNVIENNRKTVSQLTEYRFIISCNILK